MRAAILAFVLMLGTSGAAHADESKSHPPVRAVCSTFFQCGGMGAPCCLGPWLHLGKQRSDMSMTLAQIFARIEPIAVAHPDDVRSQLTHLMSVGELEGVEDTLRPFAATYAIWQAIRAAQDKGAH